MFQLNQNKLIWLSFAAICYFSFGSLWSFWITFTASTDAVIERHMDFIWTPDYKDLNERSKQVFLYLWIAGEMFISTLKLAVPGMILLIGTRFITTPIEGTHTLSFRKCVCAPHLQVWLLVPVAGVAAMFSGL